MVTRSQGVRKSNFPEQSTIPSGSTFDYVINGVNYKITVEDMVTAFGTTGTVVAVGDATGAQVLDDQGLVKGIRSIKNGDGISVTVNANNSVQVTSGLQQDNTGVQIFDNLAQEQPTAGSLVAGPGVNITKTSDAITFSVGADIGGISRVLVQSASDLAGTLDSSKEYFIDGIIDMGTQEIEIPTGGLTFSGYNFEVSQLVSSENNYTMFNSPVAGSGTIIMKDLAIDVSGISSQVFDLKAATGNEAFEFFMVNFNNCTSLGIIDGYRQGLENGTGRFGGTPNLQLASNWAGGYNITTSIVRSLDAGFTGALFEDGGSLVFNSRFRMDLNVDLPASASLLDFAPANFANPSLCQIDNAIVTRNGVSDPMDSNLTPNIDASDLECAWSDNQGINNTHEGGKLNISTASATAISVISTPVDMAGTWDPIDLQHFDEPANGQLRHLGNDPRDYTLISSFEIQGTANDEIEVFIEKWDNSASSFSTVFSQARQINNVVGGNDTGYWTISTDFSLDQNDYIKIMVANNTSTDNVTAQTDSFFKISAR